MTDQKKYRNPIVAAVLNLLSPGLGFLYIGRIAYAVGMLLAIPLVFVLASWTNLIFTLIGYYFVILFLFSLIVGSLVAAALFARRLGSVSLQKYQRWYFYLLYFILVNVVLNVVVISHRSTIFGFETFRFPSGSMTDTLLNGDFFISNTWKFRSISPERTEIIVFLFPADPSIKFVKRVIGLPGDVVEMKSGVVYVNGTGLLEPYVKPENNIVTAKLDERYVVPKDSYFVLGDNRDRSNDSRYWGFVPSSHIHGDVGVIWFSYTSSSGIRFDRLGMQVK